MNLLNDIKNDNNFKYNIKRLFFFICLLMVLDWAISKILENGIKIKYGLESNSEILMIGHSHLMLAIDKVELEKRTNRKVAKYTREGVNVADRYEMIKQYFDGPSDNCHIVIYGIDPWLFSGKDLSENSYTLFLPFMDNPDIDKYIYKNSKNHYEYWIHKIIRSSRYNVLLINNAIRGYLHNWSNLKYGTININAVKKEISSGDYRHISYDVENIQHFKKTIDFLSQKKVKVFFVNTPISYLLKNALGKDYTKSINMIKGIVQKYPDMYFIDLSPGYSKNSELFYDPIHMNPQGQKVITEEFIKKLLNHI